MRNLIMATALASTLVLSACSSEEPATGLNIYAASSTRVINEALQAQTDSPLNFNNAGSSTLVQQLKDGAPADLLLTASRKTMDQAVADGTVSDPQVLATNVMVMVVPADNPAGINSVTDIDDKDAFILCDPQVPCGDVASHIIADQGLTLKADSLEGQVADVLSRVVSGEADAGWVYSTDAASAGDAVKVIEIPGADKYTNEVLGAVTTGTSHKQESTALLDTLTNNFADEWEKFGFAVPEDKK